VVARSALHEAVKAGNLPLVKRLFAFSPEASDLVCTPLHSAAGHGQREVALFLLEKVCFPPSVQ
jgi:ankyrin repeat protein